MKKNSVRAQNVGIFLIDRNNCIFCVHCPRGFNPPGGRIEDSDFSHFTAAAREFREECGSELPLKEFQLEKAIYRNRARACVIYYNKYALDKKVCDSLIESYNRKKIKWQETNDCAFVPIDLLARQHHKVIRGSRYNVRGRVAGFVPRVTRFLERQRGV